MPDRKVVKRLITYDGPVDWIEKTLSKSLAEGRNVIGSDRTITISTITIADSEECTRNPLDMKAGEEGRGNRFMFDDVTNAEEVDNGPIKPSAV